MESTTDANLSLIFDSQENNNPQQLKQFDGKLTNRNFNPSSILNEVDINRNNNEQFNEDDLNLLNINYNCNSVRPSSNRRSSILKTNFEKNEIRNSRRVSWAQTYQFKKLLEDGTTVVTSQELNKFGPEPLRKSTESAATTSTGQNLANSNETNQNDPTAIPTADEDDSQQNAEMVKQKVQLKVANKNYTKVLSKYYNTEDKKDYQTVVNTAANRFGIDPTTTDLSKLLDLDQNSATVLEPPKNEADRQQAEANSENIKIFLKQFNKSQERNSNLNILMKALEKNVSNSNGKKTKTNLKSQPKPKEKLDDSLEKIFETELTNNNNMSLIFDSSKVYTSANLHNSTKLSTDQPSSQDFWNQMSMLDESSITINHSKDSPVEITKLTVPGEMSPGGNFEIFIDDQTCQAKVVAPPVATAECMSIHDTTMMAISNDQEDEEQPVPVEDSNKKNDADNFLMKLPEYSGNLSSMFTDSSDDSGLLVVPSAVVSIAPKNLSLQSSNIHQDSQKENGIVDLSNKKLLIEESKPNKQLVDNVCESENLEDLLEVTEKIAFHEKLTLEEDQDDDNLTLTNVFTCNNLEMELEQQKHDETLVEQTEDDSSQQPKPMGEDQIAPISMIEETDLSVCVESQKENFPVEIVTTESSQKQNIVNANDFDLNQEEDMAIDEETVANFDAANFICKLQSQVESQKNSSARLETTEILMIEETVNLTLSETEKIDESLKTIPEDLVDSQKENQQQSMAIEDTNLSFSAILVDKKLEILSESQFPDSQKENLVSDCPNKRKSVEKVFEILSESMVISDSQKENFVSDCVNKKKSVEKVCENLSESMAISDSQKENEPVFQISNKISLQETATGILGFFNGTIGNCSSITNDEGQSTIEKFAENTKAANLSSSMVVSQKVQEVPLLSKTTDENQSSISFKTIPCNFNTSGFGQENSKLCTPIPVLSSTRIVNEMNVAADCSNEELEERTTGSLKKCPELTMNDGDRTEFSEFTLRANEDQNELTVDEVSHMDLDDFDDDDDDNGRMSKSFQNSSNVSIVMVDTGNENRDTRPFPHDDDENSVPIKVEVYEITNNKLDRDDDDEEEHTAYVPTKPFLGKAALLLEDEEEEEETQVDDEEEKSPEEMQITEVVEPSIELATNQPESSSPPLKHNLDRTNQSLGKPIEFDQSNLTGFKRPCEFGSTNFSPLKKSSPSPAENKTSSSAQVSSIPVLSTTAAANFRSSKSKTSQFNIPFASLNMELANLDRNNVELSSLSSTTSTTTTTAVINRSFLPLLPQIGGNRRSISSTTSLFSRFNQNRLSNQSTSLFNRGQTTVLTQQQKIQTEVKPKNPIELDFNKSQEASLIKTPSKSNKNCLTRENDSGEQQFNTQQFIRKSLGLNLREMLLEKLKKREEEEVEVEKNEPKATNVSCVIQSMTQILDQTESRDCSKIDGDNEINANRPSISATMEEEMELDESKCSANQMSFSSISFTGTSSKLKLELTGKQSDSPLPITTKIQPLETGSLTDLPLNTNKSMQTTTKILNQSIVDADETYLNSIITADDEDDELDDDAKVFFNQSINFSMHFVDDEDEEDESPPITLNASSKMTKRRESIIPSIDSGKQPEVSVVSASSSMEVSQNSLTLTPQSDESIFNFTLSPWRREYSRVEDYNKMEATLEYRYTQMFDAFEEANYCQTLKMDRKLYGSILRLNLDELNIRIQKFESDQFVARFLWSTVELRVRFGSTVAKTPNKSKTSTSSSSEVIREIIALDILSLIDSNRELPQRIMAGKEDCPLYDAECYDLKFLEEHRSILLLAHDYVLCHFTEKRDQLMHKYRNSCDLSQLLTEISLIVSSGRKMAREVRTIFSGEVCQFIPLDSDGKFRICVELLALRKPIELHLAFNPLMYPDEVIRPTIVVPDKDKHLYPLDQFSSALLMIKPGNFNYIKRLIRASRYFIKALRIVMRQIRRSRKQSEAIKLARLEPSPRQSILPPVVAVHDDPPKFA